MKRNQFNYLPAVLALLVVTFTQSASLAYSLKEHTTQDSAPVEQTSARQTGSHIKARMDPLHFKPGIESASNQQCLQCHQEILQRKPRTKTQAGVKSEDILAWYQTIDTYLGEQDSFHRRHLRHLLPASDPLNSPDDSDPPPLLMSLNCNTCHQGHNINKEVSSDVHSRYSQPELTKEVSTDTCLMCHGTFDFTTMPGVTGSWLEMANMFGNSCMACHGFFRTNAHDVNFLNKETIKQAGATDGEVCFGCHGGRSWYNIAYPYPRNPWPGMSTIMPEWAKQRPTTSAPRFLINIDKPVKE